MFETMKTSVIVWAGRVRNDRDGSLYGSLWVVAASLGVLAILLLYRVVVWAMGRLSSQSHARRSTPALERSTATAE